jgi:hypothetical protein
MFPPGAAWISCLIQADNMVTGDNRMCRFRTSSGFWCLPPPSNPVGQVAWSGSQCVNMMHLTIDRRDLSYLMADGRKTESTLYSVVALNCNGNFIFFIFHS